MPLNTKKTYIEGVVKEFIGAHNNEIMASINQHQLDTTNMLLNFEGALQILESRVMILENNALGTTLRKDTILAIVYNLIAIANYKTGYDHALDTVEPY